MNTSLPNLEMVNSEHTWLVQREYTVSVFAPCWCWLVDLPVAFEPILHPCDISNRKRSANLPGGMLVLVEFEIIARKETIYRYLFHFVVNPARNFRPINIGMLFVAVSLGVGAVV